MTNNQLPLIEKHHEIKQAIKVFKAIDHPVRKKILKLLDKKREIRVTDIYVLLNIEQSLASQHLRILREVKIVESKRVGQSIVYAPNYRTLSRLEKIVSEIVTKVISD